MKIKLIFLLMLVCAYVKAQQFPMAILPGDYPDPTILRDGKDYYITHSPFYYSPGFLIWHSTDLQHWEPICRAATGWKGSALAPDLVKCDGKYYIYFPAGRTIYVIWANKVTGPWSKPIDLKTRGIDPGHLKAKDGKRYLYTSEGYVVPLTDDGLATAGEPRQIYDGWVYPADWETECMCLESPKLTYKDGYYYLTCAQGGTAGPATSHMVVSARSKSPMGPWENSPYNPIVHTYSAAESWWSKGHGSLVDDVNGNWWIVYHAYSNGMHTLGRQTLIEPVEWTADGWFKTKAEQQFPKQSTPTKPITLSDDFSERTLGLQWTFWHEYAPEALHFAGNGITIDAKGKKVGDGRLLLTTAMDERYETEVEVNIGKSNMAGLLLFYNERAYAGLVSNGRLNYLYSNMGNRSEMPCKFGSHFFIRLRNDANELEISASKDGKDWQILKSNIDVSSLNHNNYLGFYALRIGLVSAIGGKATFRNFKYKRI